MADKGRRSDPLRGYKFEVSDSADNIAHVGFTEVTGLEAENEIVDYREGNEQNTPRKLAGMTSWTDIVLKRGLLLDRDDMFTWAGLAMAEIVDGDDQEDPDIRTNITIRLKTRGDKAAYSWLVRQAQPAKFVVSDMNSGTSDVLVTEVTVAHEGWRVSKSPGAAALAAEAVGA